MNSADRALSRYAFISCTLFQ